jgi:diphosphomevalonate decarboxylase
MQSDSLFEKYKEEAIQLLKQRDFHSEIAWQSPSNIALVKYWGKHGNQLPNNPSVSLSLSVSRTETRVKAQRKTTETPGFQFLFEGKESPAFGQKIQVFVKSIIPAFPFLTELDLVIESKNTFPHSSGIASSASSMSALVMCLIEIERQITSAEIDLQKASFFSRLGSGSAARSVFPHAAEWGFSENIKGSSDEFAISLSDNLHPIFKTYRDSILIIHSGTKSVSSRAGHALMENNPFAEVRYQEARNNTVLIMNALQNGDLEKFIDVTESEALQLHALMMTSNPSYILMQPGSLAAISAIRNFRKQSSVPLCFTLDAGPNIHLLYPEEYRESVSDLIHNELLPLCHNNEWIDDCVGTGASKLNNFEPE